MNNTNENKKHFVFDVEQELKALWVRLVDNVNSVVLTKKEYETTA